MENKSINSLRKLGLSTYEAQAYIAINSMISGKAIEISENSGIPRSKIYNVLKQLHEKGYVEIQRGRPLKYTVVPAKDIFEKQKDKLIKELNETEEKLTNSYENQISQVQAPIWLIHSSEKIIKKEIEIIKRTKKTLNMRIGFLLDGEAEKLIETFEKLPKEVEINILASPQCYIDNKKIEIIKTFKTANLNNLNIIKADVPFVKMMIRDGYEMFHTYTKFSGAEKNIISNSAIGIWNQYKDIANNYDKRFNAQFKKKEKNFKNKKPKNKKT